MIKEYRKKRGYTQERLAEELFISTRQLQRIEKNETSTTLETLKRIKKILKIPSEEIIQIFEDKDKDEVKNP